MSGLSNAARTEKSRADRAEALRLWQAGYSRTAIRARLRLGRSTVDRYLAGQGRQPPALTVSCAAQSTASAGRAEADAGIARGMEARGFDRTVIAARLGVSRRRVGELLGPPERKEQPVHDKTEPVGDLPTWISPTVGDYERDTRPAPAPKADWFNNRAVSGHDQDVIEQAREAARVADAAFWGVG
jgi:hypothetical protein